jgi:hypothetical protein
MLGAIALALLLLGGCGGGSSTTATIDLRSPAVKGGVTDPSVRCGWGSIWIPVEWGTVPEGTKELAVYIGRFKYVNEGGRRKLTVPFGELVSHIKPSVRKVPANVLPEGASWSNSSPVSCPVGVNGQRVLLGLLALDQVQERRMTHPLAMRLTEEALKDEAQQAGSPGTLTSEAIATDWLLATYTGLH